MSRVIKAGLARMLPPEEPDQEPEREEQPSGAAEEEEEASAPELDQDTRAAYDELIEAATNEVAYILEDARREALSLRTQAIAEAETTLAEAKEQGYAEGLHEGREAGMAEVREGFRELFDEGQKSIDALAGELHAHYDRLLEGMQENILRLCLGIAEKILGQTLETETDAFNALVETALNAVKADANLAVYVNPTDFLAHYQERDSVLDTRRDTVVPVSADPSVPPGGCWIDTETGIADASIDAQLEQIAFHLGLVRRD